MENQKSTPKTGILLVMFGAESNFGNMALRSFTERVRTQFPNITIRHAFTSDKARERIALNSRRKSDSVSKALSRMIFEKFTRIAIQPLHIVPGFEYEGIAKICAEDHGIAKITLGKPLIHEKSNINSIADIILSNLPQNRSDEDAFLIIGHGSLHPSTNLILHLGKALKSKNEKIFTSVMQGGDTLDDVLPLILKSGAKKVWMIPLLAMIGGHMLNDIAGDGNISWKSRIKSAGLECVPVMSGIAEIPNLASIWIQNLEDALKNLSKI